MANKALVPEAKEALERFKMEAASEVGVNLKQGYNGDLTSKQAGSVGGQTNNPSTQPQIHPHVQRRPPTQGELPH